MKSAYSDQYSLYEIISNLLITKFCEKDQFFKALFVKNKYEY